MRITKEIVLENVHFEHRVDTEGLALHHLVFEKDVFIDNTVSVLFSNSVFNGAIEISSEMGLNTAVDYLEKNYDHFISDIGIFNSRILGIPYFELGGIEVYTALNLYIMKSEFEVASKDAIIDISLNNIRSVLIDYNQFIGEGTVAVLADKISFVSISDNDFGQYSPNIHRAGITSSTTSILEGNTIHQEAILDVDAFTSSDIYRWSQWRKQVISREGYDMYVYELLDNQQGENKQSYEALFVNDSVLNDYKQHYRFENENAYKFEKKLLGNFYDFYKSQHDADYANEVYIELKDVETSRLKHLYDKSPSFKMYFTWKINQFLKVFSAYGTDPSKSVIISIYVIILFAFVYMFFPNSWDSMNRNRLMNRIRFYVRYFRGEESMKDIYQAENQQSTLTFTEFKSFMNESEKEIPKYFIWLSEPLYYFSSTNYKLISKMLGKIDILKGRWIDLSASKKISTSFLMGCWILALLVFDILLKFINSLTLSINTFTTLGFGEIPTTGFPRYLSIIQGFIGWFMLSIFSVSLISQLLA